jgi:predicted RNase H-like HicB family nuclease
MGLVDYISAAMKTAKYKILEDGSYYGSIPGFSGVWARQNNLEVCRRELHEVLEDWIVIKLRDGDRLPPVNGRKLKVPAAVHA